MSEPEKIEKKWGCSFCKRMFASKGDRRQHMKAKHKAEFQKREAKRPLQRYDPDCPRKIRADIASEVFDELPDGAFFAAASDIFGVEPEDFIE